MHKPMHWFTLSYDRMHLVHDDAKDKEFELELSWIGAETGGLHLAVPTDLYEDANQKGKDALDADMDD
jgi:20S proteasome subunit alpha 7